MSEKENHTTLVIPVRDWLNQGANTASRRWNVRQPTRLGAGAVLPLDVLTPDLVLPFLPQPFESLSWKPGGNFKCQLVKKKKTFKC